MSLVRFGSPGRKPVGSPACGQWATTAGGGRGQCLPQGAAARRTLVRSALVGRASAGWGASPQRSQLVCPQVFPVTSSGAPVSEYPFVRTGLLGFVGPGGLVFVVGKMDGLMVVSGRRHNADDIVATALAVEPMKFVYRGRWVCPL